MNKQNSNLTRQDFKTLGLAALGGSLELYDFIVFVFFAKFIAQVFFPADIPLWLANVQALGIFAAGYLVRPLGGIIMGHFGDTTGRKKMFSLSIILMALPTLLIGCLPTYQTIGAFAPILLLLMRLCQGLAVGGEVPGAWTFVAEHVSKQRIGFACGLLTAGLSIGTLLGSFVSTIINTVYTENEIVAFGWRIPFILGGIFGLISIYLRRYLKETPIFLAMQQRRAEEAKQQLPLFKVLTNNLPQTFIAIMLSWILSAAILVIILMTPQILHTKFNIPTVTALQANCVATITLTLGCLIYGLLADRFKAAPVYTVGCLIAAITVALFYFSAASHPQLLYITYALTGLAISVVGSFAFFMVRAYPAAVRYSGVAFSFNIAYAISGSVTPILISLLTDFNSRLAPGLYVAIIFFCGSLLGLLLLKKERQYTDPTLL